jgi:cobalt/nickel transport system permease protein
LVKHPLHASGYHPPFDSPLHRLDGRTKLIAAVAMVIAVVSTPPQALAAFAGFAALLGVALAIGRAPLGYVLRRWLVVVPFVAAAAVLPLVGHKDVVFLGLPLSRAGLVVLWNVAAKATLAVTAMTLLTASTHLADLLEALRRLKAPAMLVMLVGLTYRYLFILADEAARMKRAADTRGYGGKWLWHAGAIGRIVGVLFLRGYERGERVHAAMLVRGFDGATIPGGHAMRPGTWDWLTLAVWLAALAALRIVAA